MTNAPVSDVGIFNPYINETGGVMKADATDFAGTFKDAIESKMESMKNDLPSASQTKNFETSKENDAVKKDEPVKSETSAKKETKSEKTDAKETAKDDEVSTDVAKKVVDKEKEVVNKISEEMNVSKEEVLDAMEALGLSMMDLLDESNMADVVAKLSGNQDVLTIVTDENLYQSLENLQNFVTSTKEDLMEELDLSQEALDEVLVQTEELEQHPIAENEILNIIADKEKPLEGMKDFKTTIIENGEQITVNVEVNDTSGAQIATYEGRGNSQFDNEDSSNNNKSMQHEDKNQSRADIPLFTENTQLNNFEVPNIDVESTVPHFSPDAQNIAEQIVESMKVNMKAETTELEMNLHPASLGNVRVNLSSNGGQITAQFMAQNETVRAAIESQVVMLTKQLEEQGIKIEAVEVTLASHQFETGAGQTGTNNGQPDKESDRPKISRTRRIDLNELNGEEEIEELDEADRIAADMMVKNGNTVDYTA